MEYYLVGTVIMLLLGFSWNRYTTFTEDKFPTVLILFYATASWIGIFTFVLVLLITCTTQPNWFRPIDKFFQGD